MKKQGLLTIAAVAVAALFLSTLPSSAQDQGQGQGQGRRGGQGRGGQGGGFGGGQFGGRGGMMGGMNNNDPTTSAKMFLIQRDDVRSELAISTKQREQMDSERQKATEEMRNNRPNFNFQELQNLSPEERRQKMQEIGQQMQAQMATANEKTVAKVEAVLTPAQQKRLGELDLQWRGPLSLSDEKVAGKIKLTPDQQRQVTNIVTEYRTAQQEVMRNAFGGFGGGRGPGGQPGAAPGGQGGQPGAGAGGQGGRPQFDPEAMRTRMEAMQKENDKAKKASSDKIVALLTAEQKTTWKTLQGKAFTFRATEQGPPRS